MIPEAQPIVQRVAEVYLRHVAEWFVGLLAHGSAVKGGFIPGCSDIDLQLYLTDEAFHWQGSLPVEVGLAVRRELGKLNLGPFRYVQCYPRHTVADPKLVGPIPGAYHIIAGRLPIPEATAEDLRQSARQALEELKPAPEYLGNSLIGPGGGRLERNIRLLCTQVWPVLYQMLVLQGEAPIFTWCLRKEQAIQRLPQGSPMADSIQRYYRALWSYYPTEESLEDGLTVIQFGVAFLQAAKDWWAANFNRA